jgi:hypothetical protein
MLNEFQKMGPAGQNPAANQIISTTIPGQGQVLQQQDTNGISDQDFYEPNLTPFKPQAK